MNPARRRAVAMMAAVLLAGPSHAAPAAAPRPPRAELESLQAAVEAAVTRVSRPAGLMFGRPSRAYHLKGYGAVVVLAPRALPRVHRHTTDGPEARAYADVLRRLERSLDEVSDPEERRRLEEALLALRDGLPPGRPLRMRVRPHLAVPPRDSQELQEEAEAFRREAERAMENAEREVILRLRVDDDVHPVVLLAPPDAGELPEPPEAPIPMVVPVPAVPPMPAVPAVLPTPPTPPVPAIPPGWSFWFGDVETDDAPPDQILADVRRAIVTGLGAYRGGLALLGPDEFVVVAVDFVPRMADRAGSRTVVARARTRDLADHRAGRLSAEALNARVEFDEY